MSQVCSGVTLASGRAMTRFGYHASHEQYSPSEMLRLVGQAEDAGFDGVLCSDHFHPWLEENAHSGFVWSWLGAALEATGMTFGTVNAPGDRYHPAIVAQAAAALSEMYPGRFWLAVGSGEALNEHVTGREWPPKPVRQARLLECVDIMRALWQGETVTHRGLVTVEEARLYSLPLRPPMLLAAAVSEETAEWAGKWADGLITTGRPREEMRKMIDAFHRGGGEGKRIAAQHGLSWAPNEREAKRAAHEQWRFSALGPDQLWNLRTPMEFARATQSVTEDDVAEGIRVSAELGQHAEWLADYAREGVDEVYCFNVGKNQDAYIEAFGERVLPELGAGRDTAG